MTYTYEFSTLPVHTRAAFGLFVVEDRHDLWAADAYQIVLRQMEGDEFCTYIRLRNLVEEVGELLTLLFNK
jgi:hypothetical protein